MQHLKQSTAVTLKIGPFLDSVDGITPETALTITESDIYISKDGGELENKNDITSCTHDLVGVYSCPIGILDTATIGRFQMWIYMTGALPVWHEFMIMPANVYDSLYGISQLYVDVQQISSDSNAADNLELDYDGTGFERANSTIGVCTTNSDMVGTTGANTTVPDAAGTAATLHGTTNGLVTTIDGVVDAILVDTNDLQTNQGNWLTATGFNIVVPDVAGTAPTAAQTADAVWDELISGHILADSFGAKCRRVVPSESIEDYKADAPTAVQIREEIDSNSTRLDADISTRSTLTSSQVNMEIVDVLKIDITEEMAQGDPPTTPTFEDMISHIYFRMINKCETTSTEDSVFDAGGTVKLFKATIGDDGITFSKSKYVSGA